MRLARPVGVRAQIVAAMVVLALASVALTAAEVNRAVDVELRDLSHRELRISAANAAETAAAGYLEDGGWSARTRLFMTARRGPPSPQFRCRQDRRACP